jgi:hypothetical protein
MYNTTKSIKMTDTDIIALCNRINTAVAAGKIVTYNDRNYAHAIRWIC